MDDASEAINWSAIAQQAFREAIATRIIAYRVYTMATLFGSCAFLSSTPICYPGVARERSAYSALRLSP